MSDKKKFLKGRYKNLRIRNNPDLKGFEEVLDLVPTKIKKKKPHKNKNKKGSDDFALLNLLESEHERLKKLCDLFDEKVRNRVTFSQQKILYKKQLEYRDDIKTTLLDEMKRGQSPFSKNISIFFNRHF